MLSISSGDGTWDDGNVGPLVMDPKSTHGGLHRCVYIRECGRGYLGVHVDMHRTLILLVRMCVCVSVRLCLFVSVGEWT